MVITLQITRHGETSWRSWFRRSPRWRTVYGRASA